MSRHIGIVAVSAEGAALCYETICKEGAALMGRHLHPEITLHNLPLAKHMEFVEADDWKGLGELMARSAHKLIGAGAELLICPDNTNHLGFAEASSQVSVPWLHIAEEVAVCARDASYRKVGVLGTKFLMESDIYPTKLAAHGIDYLIPGSAARQELNDIIFDELVYGKFTPQSKSSIEIIIETLRANGCDAVILGCTELPLIVSNSDSPLPALDSTRILARAALREALAPEESSHQVGR